MTPRYRCPRIQGEPTFLTTDTCAQRKARACSVWHTGNRSRGGLFMECLKPRTCPGPIDLRTGKVVRVAKAKGVYKKMSARWADILGYGCEEEPSC